MSNAITTSSARGDRTSAGLAAGFARSIAAVVKTVDGWRARARQRQQLLSLDDHMLRDIGLTRSQVLFEVRKRPWQR